MEIEEAKKELARLITLFYDCRKERGVTNCYSCPEYLNCRHEELHRRYWLLLIMFKELRRSDPAIILEPYLSERPDVLEFLRSLKKMFVSS